MNSIKTRNLLRLLQTSNTFSTGKVSEPTLVPPMKKAVLVSTSNDIYANLALENWFYKNHDFSDNHLLMLWVNDPCVVIGRHQNPWTEADVSGARELGLKIARRHSGGGTVYHDRGNLNMTFFTPREHYNRRYNLEFVANAILNEFGLKVDISPREDLTVRNFKVSGTAAKVARTAAYHHCTLLIDANKEKLGRSLKPSIWEIDSTATKSIKSNITNLSAENSNLTVEKLLNSIGVRYLSNNNRTSDVSHPSLVNEMNSDFHTGNEKYSVEKIDFDSLKFHLFDPLNEGHFKGITEMREEVSSWDWIFGKTPKFTAKKTFMINPGYPKDVPRVVFTSGRNYALLIELLVENGRITDVTTKIPDGYKGKVPCEKFKMVHDLQGAKYSDEVINYFEKLFGENEIESAQLN